MSANQAHVRIDEGIKRGPKAASLVRYASRTKSKRGHAGGLPIPLETRTAILEDAKQLILAGSTIDSIAAKHGISSSTLQLWLSALGDEYQDLRNAWLDGMLVESGELLKTAADALSLARGRELWRRATWYAERRDRARYGDKLEIQTTTAPVLHIHCVAESQHAAPLQPIDGIVTESVTSK